MAPTKNEDLNAWIKEVIETDVEDAEIDFFSLCEFAGYNPRTIFKKVWAECRNNSQNVKLLRMIIHFGLTRGFGRGKSIATLVEKTNSPDGKILIQSACQVFTIKVGVKKTMDMVTIDRIMGAFPSLTYSAWFGMLRKNQVHDQCGYDGPLPMEFRYPGAAGIMNEELFSAWRIELIKWNGSVQDLWSRNRPDNQRKTDEETANFIDIQYYQSIFPLQARDKFWIEERERRDEEAAGEDESSQPTRPVQPAAVQKRGSPSGSKTR